MKPEREPSSHAQSFLWPLALFGILVSLLASLRSAKVKIDHQPTHPKDRADSKGSTATQQIRSIPITTPSQQQANCSDGGKKRTPWWEKEAVLVVLGILGVNGWKSWETRKSADAAKSAADTAASQLELAERPWVDANITVSGSISFNENGANVPIKIAMKNSGHSPARSTSLDEQVFISGKTIDEATDRDSVCKVAINESTATHFGIALFPNRDFEQEVGIGLSKEAIAKGNASKIFPNAKFGNTILSPYAVVCIAYLPAFKSGRVYHTSYIIDLIRRDAANHLVSITFRATTLA